MKSTGPVGDPDGSGPSAPVPDRSPGGPERRRGPGPSTRPALIVLGLAIGLFVAGAVAGGLVAQGGGSSPLARSVPTARGAVLHAVPAREALRGIISTGQPPDDLVAALAVPAGSTPVPGSATDRGVGLYDRSLQLQVGASEAAVISFFRAQLPFEQWRVVSEGPVSGGPEYRVIAQHPASDGREWEVGATVSATVFPNSGAGGTPTGTTPFTLRLFALSDQA